MLNLFDVTLYNCGPIRLCAGFNPAQKALWQTTVFLLDQGKLYFYTLKKPTVLGVTPNLSLGQNTLRFFV